VGLFGFRRKQLLRGIRELTGRSAATVTDLLRDVGVSETVRPEMLTPADFARLYRKLVDGGWNTGLTL
ncbi:MAG TPA: hypothetical protein VHH32_05065, partial [Gemmatimonadales bacterium]|nr:hypothetical protein [Gemmatimonadales bacterium]